MKLNIWPLYSSDTQFPGPANPPRWISDLSLEFFENNLFDS